MEDDGRGILIRPDATPEEIRHALSQAVAHCLAEHQRAGRSVVQWDRTDDRIISVPAENLPQTESSHGIGNSPAPITTPDSETRTHDV